jgi:D-glycero-D-manno-heptose 1,7-bisphosphate phosphatase
LGRGLFDMAALNAMHAKMNKMLAAVGAGSMRCFFVPMGPKPRAIAASPRRACLSKSPNALAFR